MKIYTKKGDKGLTKILGGKTLEKSNIRIESYGTIDELNAYLGLIYNSIKEEEVKIIINKIQNKLFVIGSLLASDPDKKKHQNT